MVLALGTFAVGTDGFVVAGFLPDMAASLHVTTASAGQSVTVFAVAYAVLSPVLATLTARVPRRALLVGALLVLAAANLATAYAPNFAMLLLTRVLAAAAAAAYSPGATAVASALVRPEQRARAVSVVVGGMTVAIALGVPLGAVAERALDWRTALVLVAALAAACAVGVRAIMPALPGGPRVALRDRLAVLRRPGVLAVLPQTVVGMTAAYAAYAYSVPVLRAAGAGSAVTWMLFLYGAGAVLGNIAAGAGTDRFGSVRVLAIGYALMTACLAVLAWAIVGDIRSFALTGAVMVAWGASSWCQGPPQNHRLIGAAPGQAPLVAGLNASAIYAGIALGTLAGGLAVPHGVALAVGLGAGLAAVACLYLAATARHR
jgi:predicted MFS family arabinose efflux permease